MPVRCLIYQQLGDLRVLSNAAVGRQDSHESGDGLAMDGPEQETAGKRKTNHFNMTKPKNVIKKNITKMYVSFHS